MNPSLLWNIALISAMAIIKCVANRNNLVVKCLPLMVFQILNKNVQDEEIPASFVLPFGHQVSIYLEISFIAAAHKV
jgi:hypothetical protein